MSEDSSNYPQLYQLLQSIVKEKATLGKSDFALAATEKYLKEVKEFIDLDSISGVQSWRNEVEVQVQSAKLLKAAEVIAQEVILYISTLI